MCLECGSSEFKTVLFAPRGDLWGLGGACSSLFWPESEPTSFPVHTSSGVLSGLPAAHMCSLCCFPSLVSEVFFQNTILPNAA